MPPLHPKEPAGVGHRDGRPTGGGDPSAAPTGHFYRPDGSGGGHPGDQHQGAAAYGQGRPGPPSWAPSGVPRSDAAPTAPLTSLPGGGGAYGPLGAHPVAPLHFGVGRADLSFSTITGTTTAGSSPGGCMRTFSKSWRLQAHVRVAHLGVRQFKCDTCAKRFPFRSDLLKHTREVHLKHRPYACSACAHGFAAASKLKAHYESVHEKKRPYVCEEAGCTKRFGYKSDLKKHHLAIHQLCKPYVVVPGLHNVQTGDVSMSCSCYRLRRANCLVRKQVSEAD
ncbi:hypothetical protein I4F81_007199 [Pyropia yezoensis]|uniref:Uncharacterized protein n=1 Tax=Pyropia yezoensis TaxID=2788 RepID=A0ACC3C3F9_PYRYE|nr:hypothetical protein I4F81_007199 [Neopyropia yezoensis]